MDESPNWGRRCEYPKWGRGGRVNQYWLNLRTPLVLTEQTNCIRLLKWHVWWDLGIY